VTTSAGGEEPVTKPRASLATCSKKSDQGSGTKWREHGRPFVLIQDQVSPSAAKAATERSEGVAGAKRLQAPANPPQGEPSI